MSFFAMVMPDLFISTPSVLSFVLSLPIPFNRHREIKGGRGWYSIPIACSCCCVSTLLFYLSTYCELYASQREYRIYKIEKKGLTMIALS